MLLSCIIVILYFYNVDNSDCETLNCSQICVNTTGSLTCACHPGYYLNTVRECEGDYDNRNVILCNYSKILLYYGRFGRM